MALARRIMNRVTSILCPPVQLSLSVMMSGLARARMWVVTDSGTRIGVRNKLFATVIPSGGVGAELGVYKGTLSQHILKVNRPSHLFLVDPWWKYKSDWHWAVGDTSAVRSFAALLLVLRSELSMSQVDVYIGGSKEFLESCRSGQLDWAYIDSTHSYEHTKIELSLLKHKVNTSGIIAGDDWTEDKSHRHHGVYRAVHEFLQSESEYELIFQEDTQWAIAKKTRSASEV